MSNKKTESGVKKTKYTQRYKPEWERLPEFQRWLKPSDKGMEHAFCKICAMHFNISSSGRTYLSRHMNCSKHIQLTKILYDSSNHDSISPVKMESIPIRKYTRKPKVAKKPAETPPPLMPKEEYVVTNDNRVIVVNYDVGGTVEDPVLIPIPSDKDSGSSPKKHGSVVTVPNNVGKALYKVEWEDEDEFQDWIEPDPDNICNAICRICKETFTANRKTLKNHAKSIIHRRMLNLNNISKDSVNKSNISNDNDQLSSPVQPNLPNQKTIFISSDTGDQIEIEPREVESQKSSPVKTPVVTSSSSTKRKFAKLRDNFDIDKKFEPKLNINKLSTKTCSHGCLEHRGIANHYQKSNMSRRVPLNCRDPFFRDLDRDFFGESNRQNWSESTPTKLFDQHFATGLWPDEVPTGTSSMYIRSRRTPREKSGFSIINSPKDKFTVLLEVPHFLPDELKVRVTGSVLEVEGKHGERQDDHGAISRQFNRKYNLPEDVMVDYISSSLSAEGVLTIEAPKKPLEPTRPAEREVPIQKMGPAK